MSTVLIALFFLLNALLMPLVVELVKERAAGLALRVIRLAVRLLPRAHRDRHREEWTAELDEMERQNVSQLVSSLRILLGAPSMGWVLRVRDRRQRLVKDGRKRLTEAGKVFRKILITLQVGGLTYLIADLTDQPQIWVLTVTVLIGGITLVVQLLKELSEGGQVSYNGEDRDWMLGLTMQSRSRISCSTSSCSTETSAMRSRQLHVSRTPWNQQPSKHTSCFSRIGWRRECANSKFFGPQP